MTTITPSKLRENIYQILDNAIATGEPVEILRKGAVLRINAGEADIEAGQSEKAWGLHWRS